MTAVMHSDLAAEAGPDGTGPCSPQPVSSGSTWGAGPGRTATHGPAPQGCSTVDAARLVGATFRIADYSARQGLVDEDLVGLGSGARRRWTDEHLEVLWAIVRLREVGFGGDLIHEAARLLRLRRPGAGERLVVVPPHHVERACADQPLPSAPVCVVLRLRRFEGLRALPA